MIDRIHWIDREKLIEFILECQVPTAFAVFCEVNTFPFKDPEVGGIADRPDDRTDIYHTFFGLAGPISPSLLHTHLTCPSLGLSLLGYGELVPVNPVYALPVPVTQNLGLEKKK